MLRKQLANESHKLSLVTIFGELEGWVIKGNSGDYYVSNYQNCPQNTPAYWRLVYQCDLWGHSWYIITDVTLTPNKEEV